MTETVKHTYTATARIRYPKIGDLSFINGVSNFTRNETQTLLYTNLLSEIQSVHN